MGQAAMMRPHPRAIAPLLFVALSAPIGAQTQATVPPRPTISPAKPFVFPKITVDTLPNGLQLAVVENHELPIVAVRVGSRATSMLDAPGKQGGWALMMSALREGTASRTAAQINDTLAQLGTDVSWNPGSAIQPNPSFTTARALWRPVLDVVADVLMNPSFPDDAIRRLQSAQATGARPAITNRGVRMVTRALYGVDHPYARSFPSDSSIRNLTRDDILTLQKRFLRPQNAFVVVVGDITRAEARAAIAHSFGTWVGSGDTVRSTLIPTTQAPQPTAIYLADVPGSQQATITAGQILPNAESPDGPAIELLNAILGGVAHDGTRFFDEFRLKHGLSYAPVSLITWRQEPQQAFGLQTAVVPAEKIDSAAVLLAGLLRDLHGARPVTAAELDFARHSLVGRLPVTTETLNGTAAAAFEVMTFRRSPRYFATYANRIASVTLAQVQAAAAKYIDPDHLVIVVAGDRARIEAPLRATGIPVVIVDH
jgi:zinc protease